MDIFCSTSRQAEDEEAVLLRAFLPLSLQLA